MSVSLTACLEAKDNILESKIQRGKEAFNLHNHGFIEDVQYRSILGQIREYYMPMLDAVNHRIKELKEEKNEESKNS